MDIKQFFKQYPDALSLWKVGDRYFLHHAKTSAEVYAAANNLKIEEITKPKASSDGKNKA